MRLLVLCAALALSACAPMMAAMSGGAPPQAPPQVQAISRTAVDVALNSFDAALSGLDFAMDAHVLQPGSAQARNLARLGRQVMNFLGAADAAAQLGSSATYEEAMSHARDAVNQFIATMPHASPSALRAGPRVHLTPAQRARILARLDSAPQV